MNTIEIDTDVYIKMLDDRKEFVEKRFGWYRMSNYPMLWNRILNHIRKTGVNPKYSAPIDIVDNIICNGDYKSFDDLKNADESDEAFIARMEDKALLICPEERSILFSL
jgi:hypothetical protein